MGGVKDGWELVELVQCKTLGQVEWGKGLPLPPLAFCVEDWGQRVAVIIACCLARVYWAGRSAVPLIRGCALNKVPRDCGGGWAWCSTVWCQIDSNKLHPDRLHSDTFFTHSNSGEPENSSAINRCARHTHARHKQTKYEQVCRHKAEPNETCEWTPMIC